MKKILILLAVTLLYACDKNDKDISYNAILGSNVDFSISNAQGEDLLDPETPNHIKESEVKLFYLINGVKKEVYNGFLTHPRNFSIHKNENEKEYHIVIFLNDIDKSDKTTTYIQWNEKETDTIETTFFREKGFIFTKDVWLNGELVFTSSFPNNTPYVKLIR
ncbi:hypothetical protein [Flavobacterium branchiicola]|uniref:Lipoprotein n=1 Tax=Flavobacterium branchiicola TaxID=1114875 RepID=A0ABV9PJS7_9FLAO|nr:hypothetical protein [Flavobacterium branchiicola]MBS7256323.1 hypothetical protein [Flavobacterium branchiicola]